MITVKVLARLGTAANLLVMIVIRIIMIIIIIIILFIMIIIFIIRIMMIVIKIIMILIFINITVQVLAGLGTAANLLVMIVILGHRRVRR